MVIGLLFMILFQKSAEDILLLYASRLGSGCRWSGFFSLVLKKIKD